MVLSFVLFETQSSFSNFNPIPFKDGSIPGGVTMLNFKSK